MNTITKHLTFFAAVLTAAQLFLSCSGMTDRDNANDPKSDKFSIKATVTPASGASIVGHEAIVITFEDPMDTASLSLSGDMGTPMTVVDNAGWSTTNHTYDTLTITPTAGNIYPASSNATLVITCNSAYGPQTTVSLSYNVEHAVYVNPSIGVNPAGDPSNPGTRTAPLSVIQDAINLAHSLYTTASVRVGVGTYNVNSTTRVSMQNGISIYGGYKSDFSMRDTTAYETIIQDTSTSGGANWDDPNRAVNCNTTISNATVIDGFTINGGGSDVLGYATAIFCNLGSSPTISNNKINGGEQLDGFTYGILNISSSPAIRNNDIYGGKGNASGYSCGIANYKSSQASPPDTLPTIIYNRIDGGSGLYSYGIENNNTSTSTTSQFSIYNNTIFGGNGTAYTYGINITNSSLKIYNNTIDAGYPTGTTGFVYCIYINNSATRSINIENNILVVERLTTSVLEYGIYEANANSDPSSVKNNDIYNCRLALYHDNDTGLDMKGINASGNFTQFLGGTGTPLSSPSASGNVNMDPLFKTPLSAGWFQADHHLTASSPVNVTQGGLDGVAQSWEFTDDFDKIIRTNLTSGSPTNTNAAGWSMGAYEKD